jgi:mono/diheme cytochrome c family protein
VGLEFVQQRAYFAQYDAGGEEAVQDGLEVFLRRCQYCHSVSDVGSSYGWDFLKPVPIHTFKKPEELTYHVKYAKMNAVQRGLRMPPQVDVEDTEIQALLKWVAALHKAKVKAYEP